QRGLLHERNYLAGLARGGKNVVEIEQPVRDVAYHDRWAAFAARTLAAMQSGADVVYQAGLFDGQWLGKPDFLIRVATPSELGDWSYEVVDTKLAREARGGALLQILLYADLLARAQGATPALVHLALGGPEAQLRSFRVADYMAYFRSVRARFLAAMARAADPPIAAEPVEHCDICAWKGICADERRDVDHLSLVANITRAQRRALVDHGTTTLATLAALDTRPPAPIDGISNAAFTRIRNQARIQLEGRRRKQHLHELLLPIEPGHGLAALPEPSPGDLFFDLEGDPYALTHGLEYLFGFVDRDGHYEGWWALDRDAERRNFERFIDFVMARLERWPDLHIYHYAPYEPSALKRLMGRYATREDEVDRLLRGRVLVDLYRVVKQGLRASVESYSIKKLEPFYGYTRDVDLRTASGALASFEAWLELGGARSDTLLDDIQGYNRDDCVSTLQLNAWLEKLRADAVSEHGQLERPVAPDGEASEALQERNEEIDVLVARLTADVPADAAEHSDEQHARWLAAQLLEFHRREDKSTWWEYFRCLELSDDEFIEDRATLGGLEYIGVVDTIARSYVHRYRFPPQDHGFRAGKTVADPATQKSHGRIIAIDDAACTIDLKRGMNSTVPHPRALILDDHVNNSVLRDSIMRVGQAIAEHGLTDACPFGAAVDLLLRRAPRAGQARGDDLMRAGETPLNAAVRLVDTLDCTVLPIQGPPGAGKTYTAARMIVRALQAGQRVGITAQSHKVIAHLLGEVCRAGLAAGYDVRGMQKADDDELCDDERIVAGDNQAVRDALASGAVRLAAGTA
ncbi:MAG: TM0106 family RecB-like putative nuclease, partial [Longimicrobiales bacterium]